MDWRIIQSLTHSLFSTNCVIFVIFNMVTSPIILSYWIHFLVSSSQETHVWWNFYKYWTSFNYVTNKCRNTLPVRAHSLGFLYKQLKIRTDMNSDAPYESAVRTSLIPLHGWKSWGQLPSLLLKIEGGIVLPSLWNLYKKCIPYFSGIFSTVQQ
jgi:hypothetical protein